MALSNKGDGVGVGVDTQRTVLVGKASDIGTNNAVYTSKYTIWSFFPLAVREQFRRNGNLYFLVMGFLMFLGTYTDLFYSSVSPWTTLGPLALVVSISLAQEGVADMARHRSDHETNNHPCVVVKRSQDTAPGVSRDPNILEGKSVDVNLVRQLRRGAPPTRDNTSRKRIPPTTTSSQEDVQSLIEKSAEVEFVHVKRMAMRAGEIVLVKNREMIPADIILLASSGENGAAYIETSPIDGETNLKLRSSPHLPPIAIDISTPRDILSEEDDYTHPKFESITSAVKRVTRMSLLGFPDGKNALLNPLNPIIVGGNLDMPREELAKKSSLTRIRSAFSGSQRLESSKEQVNSSTDYVATLTSESPNASVNTFSGKITLPPPVPGQGSMDIPLGAENILLRGAMLRNTEWVIGVACFTGEDTKLARNSTRTPSKFSRLDVLMNRTVLLILFIMMVVVSILGLFSVWSHEREFETLWYAAFNVEGTKWPYLKDMDAPEWKTETPNFLAFMFTYITLLNNFVPLSLYITVEMTTLFMMKLIGWDRSMYHKETDTPAIARSTTVTDLGQVDYVFSDKTGTLTQNVMGFKRCSVDGMVFGAPVEKAAPPTGDEDSVSSHLNEQLFHPLKRLLVGSVTVDGQNYDDGESLTAGDTLTFNAEMFLRVMSICHTVVVEKEIDASNITTQADENASITAKKGLFGGLRSRANTADSNPKVGLLGTVVETKAESDISENESIHISNDLNLTPRLVGLENSQESKSKDGSPSGFAYQAESPDEGALVSAASLEYGFQLVTRESDGVRISCSSPSLLSNEKIASGLKSGKITAKKLAVDTARPQTNNKRAVFDNLNIGTSAASSSKLPSSETWEVLAVNKFDSDRKRMSVAVRSPPELGSLPILLCKGADSSMLDPDVCESANIMMDNGDGNGYLNGNRNEGSDWEKSVMLGTQSHLGIFASEGLRTLVLGVRILSEQELADWMIMFNDAATSIKDRNEKLKDAAIEIEKKIHIVGATAIEDKLQDGVPDTIYNIGKAGIKLWVLTGDKRETAIEIGYSTKVLNPMMSITDVADGPIERVKALVAMEFIRLVKIGNLPQYGKAAFEQETFSFKQILKFFWVFVKSCVDTFRRIICCLCILSRGGIQALGDCSDDNEEEHAKRRRVRENADKIISQYIQSPDGMKDHANSQENSILPDKVSEIELQSPEIPRVFLRAQSARASMDAQAEVMTEAALRNLALATATSDSMAPDSKVIDDDVLSLMTFVPGVTGEVQKIFNKKKRTMLEKLFAVDRDVRKGKLVKHLTREKKAEVLSDFARLPLESPTPVDNKIDENIDRALVIEGAALSHFLGDPLLEEMLFAVASNCHSVIACRVSPKQKALLVGLVQKFVNPTPVTLAIGDGANDVGMIQAAQVGIGVSGLEGQQAVNASDFAIAQFRFLEDLLLIHGRWNFMRLSKVVLFSFYKNAVLVGILVLYSQVTLYSGTPVFDMWVLSAFNFVCGWPILLLGLFDRDFEKVYMKENPVLYAAGPNNEYMSFRITLRWVFLVVIHSNILYFFCEYCLTGLGGTSSAFKGLMYNIDSPGDGEGGDVKSFGTALFICLVFTLGYKVLVESYALIHGKWPAFTCRKEGDGFWSRVAYTWVGLVWLSILFTFFFLYTYQLIGRDTGASSFSPFTLVTYHMFHARAITWMLVILAPIAATIADVAMKVYANMYFPTQSQIHREVQALNRKKNKGGVEAQMQDIALVDIA